MIFSRSFSGKFKSGHMYFGLYQMSWFEKTEFQQELQKQIQLTMALIVDDLGTNPNPNIDHEYSELQLRTTKD